MPVAVVVLSAVRTPYGRIVGSLSELPAVSLGGQVVAEALRRAAVTANQVERVLLGNAAAAALKGNPAAAAAREAGLPSGLVGITVRAGCASGLLAVTLAAEAIRAGSCELVVAGGFESASSAPHLAPGLRRGLRLGGGTLLDAARHDGPVAGPAGGGADPAGFLGRDPAAALADEIAPVFLPSRRGGAPAQVDRDDAPPPAMAESAIPAAGTAATPPLADGAAALVIASASWAESHVRRPLARVSPADPSFTGAIDAAALFEVDLPAEAASGFLRRLPSGRIASVNAGGGLLPGHAAGADGARLVVHLVHALRRAGGGLGLALAAGAFGESAGILVEA